MKKRVFKLFLFLTCTLFFTCSRNTNTTQRRPIDPIIPLPTTEQVFNYPYWKTPPEMTIDTSKIYLAAIRTEIGDIKIELFANKAPIAVNNFIFLAKEKYYDNTSFHRVVKDFLAQAGKPVGEAAEGPGYNIPDEISNELFFDEPGYVAMVSQGYPDTSGSQFFINTYRMAPYFDGMATIFGKVVEGMDIVYALKNRDPNMDNYEGTKILTVEISEAQKSVLPKKKARQVNAPVLVPGKPLAKLAIADREYIYNTKPDMVINKSKSYTAQIVTSIGTVEVKLRPDIAPESVNNFYVLAKLGFWDNFPINTVIRTRYVITGAPGGQSKSDVGYFLSPEFNSDFKIERGKLGYFIHARQDQERSSSGSVLYLMKTNDPRGNYGTVFGQVSDADMELVDKLTTNDKIMHIDIIEK